MNKFEQLGKTILYHKYLYYVKGEPVISDGVYDLLEKKYVDMAKKIEKEPEIHILADWFELKIQNGFHASVVVGFPHNHPWSEAIINGERYV